VGAPSVITGVFDGFFFDQPHQGTDIGTFSWDRFIFFNFTPTNFQNSGCIHVSNGANHSITNCSFQSLRPIKFSGGIDVFVHNCMLRGLGANYEGIRDKTAIGCWMFTNNALIQNCDFAGFWKAVNINQACAVRDSRIEMCYYGIYAGDIQQAAFCADNIEMEACAQFIVIENGVACVIREVGMGADEGFSVPTDGGPNNKNSLVGIQVGLVENLIVEASLAFGWFSDAGVKFVGPAPIRAVFMAVDSTVDPGILAQFPTASGWKGMELLNRNQITFIQCNNP
jgi:hypothetical protein